MQAECRGQRPPFAGAASLSARARPRVARFGIRPQRDHAREPDRVADRAGRSAECRAATRRDRRVRCRSSNRSLCGRTALARRGCDPVSRTARWTRPQANPAFRDAGRAIPAPPAAGPAHQERLRGTAATASCTASAMAVRKAMALVARVRFSMRSSVRSRNCTPPLDHRVSLSLPITM